MRVARSLLHGSWYRWWYKLRGRRVVIGRRFRVYGRLIIRGPGSVILGDDSIIRYNLRAPVTPFTHTPESLIRIGNGVMMWCTRLGCQKSIEIGDGADLADTRIMDTNFHSIEIGDGPRRNTSGVAKRVVIGARAWLGAGSMVLKGVKVGENSIVGAGAVVTRNVPPNAVVMGNPARVVWRLRSAEKPE
jgi:acetyltransferase-like isoleucine patch superfamily enzyme